MSNLEDIQEAINSLSAEDKDCLSDGHYTFKQMYDNNLSLIQAQKVSQEKLAKMEQFFTLFYQLTEACFGSDREKPTSSQFEDSSSTSGNLYRAHQCSCCTQSINVHFDNCHAYDKENEVNILTEELKVCGDRLYLRLFYYFCPYCNRPNIIDYAESPFEKKVMTKKESPRCTRREDEIDGEKGDRN